MTEEILFSRAGDWGVVTLNREKALNALTWNMIKKMYAHLQTWAEDEAVKAVLVEGAGEKSFCAGGDIVWLHETAREDHDSAVGFFRDEYTNNAFIHNFPKPYVSLIDGIVMGGGVGISVPGDYRIAGDRTLFAMPETGIGLFPDVGGGYILPRLADGVGFYYGLTGARAKAADCLRAGIATHYVPSVQQTKLRKALLACHIGEQADSAIRSVLQEFHQEIIGEVPLDQIRADIKRHFHDQESLTMLVAGLAKDQSEFAQTTLPTLNRMSPTSMALTFEQLKRGAGLSFNENMQMELRIVSRVMSGTEFFEGVRALLVDKDKNPKWQPATIEDIDFDLIDTYFKSLGGQELQLN